MVLSRMKRTYTSETRLSNIKDRFRLFFRHADDSTVALNHQRCRRLYDPSPKAVWSVVFISVTCC